MQVTSDSTIYPPGHCIPDFDKWAEAPRQALLRLGHVERTPDNPADFPQGVPQPKRDSGSSTVHDEDAERILAEARRRELARDDQEDGSADFAGNGLDEELAAALERSRAECKELRAQLAEALARLESRPARDDPKPATNPDDDRLGEDDDAFEEGPMTPDDPPDEDHGTDDGSGDDEPAQARDGALGCPHCPDAVFKNAKGLAIHNAKLHGGTNG